MPGLETKELIKNISTGVDEIKSQQTEFKSEMDKVKTAINTLEEKARNGITTVDTPKLPEGVKFAREVKAQVVAQKFGISTMQAMKNIYGAKHPEFIKEYEALQTKAGAVNVQGTAGVLVNEAYLNEIYPILYNQLAVMALGAKKIPMPNGNINIRKLVSGSTAEWLGESQPIDISTPRFSNLKLSAKKLAVMVIQSNDLFRSASVDADMAIRDDMIMQLAVAMDKTALYGRGGDAQPLGISRTTGVNTFDGTSDDPTTGEDLYRRCVLPLKQANIPLTNLGWALSPELYEILYNQRDEVGGFLYRDQLLQGRFHGYKFKETNQVNTEGNNSDVFFGSWDKFIIGDQVTLEMEISKDASYRDTNNDIRSTFQNDELAARGIMVCDFGLIYGRAMSYGQVKLRN